MHSSDRTTSNRLEDSANNSLIRPTILPSSHPALDLSSIHSTFGLRSHSVNGIPRRHSIVWIIPIVPLENSDSILVFLALRWELGLGDRPCGDEFAEFMTVRSLDVGTFQGTTVSY